MCVCVSVCVRERRGVCVCVCVCVLIAFIQPYSQLSSRHAALACDLHAFYSTFLNISKGGVLLAALTRLMPRETAAVSARSLYTLQLCIMSLHATCNL